MPHSEPAAEPTPAAEPARPAPAAPRTDEPPGVNDVASRGLDELLALARAEAEATAEAGSQSERASDLRVRAAGLAWDGRGNALLATKLLAGAQHPVGTALRFDLALSGANLSALESLTDEVLGRGDAATWRALGEHWLLRGDERALGWALGALRAADDEMPAQTNASREGLRLALALAGRWEELVELLSSSADLPSLLEASRLASERLHDLDRARALFVAAKDLARPDQSDDPAFIERALELGVDVVLMSRRVVDRLAGEAAALAEREAAQYQLASQLGVSVESAALLAALAAGDGGFGRVLALAARARVEAALGGLAAAARALDERAERCGVASWARALRRRAAELCEAQVGGESAHVEEADQIAEEAEARWASLHESDVADGQAARALARLRLRRGDLDGAAEALWRHGEAAGDGEALARAARATELAARERGASSTSVLAVPGRIGHDGGEASDVDAAAMATRRAIERWTTVSERHPSRESAEALVRLHRQAGSKSGLITAWRRLAMYHEPCGAAACLTVAAALALDARRTDEARTLFAEAARLAPTDPLAALGCALCAESAAQPQEEADALARVLDLLTTAPAKARSLRRLSQVRRSLGQLDAAAELLAQALSLHPDDPGTLHAYALIRVEEQRWGEAAELHERAAQAAGGMPEPPLRPAELLVEAGRIYAQHLDDDARAGEALRRALTVDPDSRAALLGLVPLYRRAGSHDELLYVLQRLAALEPAAGEQVSLHLQAAEAAVAAGKVSAAIASWCAALRLDSDGAGGDTLARLTELCRRERCWGALVDALGDPAACDSPEALVLLAEACEHLERWPALRATLERQVALYDERHDLPRLAETARSLAQLHERLGDEDAATRAWHRVDEADPKNVEAAQALQRIYAKGGRHAERAAAIERELSRMGDDGAMRSEEVRAAAARLWIELAATRKNALQLPAAAALAYEEALRLGSAQAAAPLAQIYEELGHVADLLRVLDWMAEHAPDAATRVTHLLRLGKACEEHAQSERALAAYRAAFALAPADRAAFTALEHACYRQQCWPEALALYQRAIEVVEVDKQRAYRLSDLYNRRAQVELKYLGDPEAAARSYLCSLQQEPESDAAQAELERIHGGRGEWARLIEAYELRASLVRDPARRAEILRRAATVAADHLKDPARVVEIQERLHAAAPDDAETLTALERHYEATEDYERLVAALLDRAAALVDKSATDEAIAVLRRVAALREEKLRDLDGAIDTWRRILELSPTQREALDALARLYEGTERWAELVEIGNRQIQVTTDRNRKALIHFRCGSVMESKFGRDDEAIAHYEAAIQTSANCLPAVHGLRDLYLRREDWPRVVQTLEAEAKMWSEKKERAGVHAHLGAIHAQHLGDPERAMHYFESALAIDPECLPANRALFELHFERGEHAQALPFVEALVQKMAREGDPDERAEFFRKSALVVEHGGDRSRAVELLGTALDAQPENLAALERLVSIGRAHLEAADFNGLYAQLERIYRKRAPTDAPTPGSPVARLLAWVQVGQASLRERDCDLDGAQALLDQAQALVPGEPSITEAQVGLQLRLRRHVAAINTLSAFIGRCADKGTRTQAGLRLAEVLSDHALDPARAVNVLRALIKDDPRHVEAHFRLARGLYLLGRHAEAQQACERLIELAAAPGDTAPPETLARYYDYLGRIAEARSDAATATRSYRRALDLDPSYPPPTLALARRQAAAGELAQAVAQVKRALAALPAQSAPAVELRRGLARLHASFGDRREAARLLDELVDEAPTQQDLTGTAHHDAARRDTLRRDDRLVLAELALRDGDLVRAEEQLQILFHDPRPAHVPAGLLLMQLHERAGRFDRAARVGSVLRLLGCDFGDTTQRRALPVQLRGMLSEAHRRALSPPAARNAWGEAFTALRESLEAIYPPPHFGNTVVPADAALTAALLDVARLLGVDAEVWLARGVAARIPCGVLVVSGPRPTVILDATILDRPDGERRFLIGRALELARPSHSAALLFRLRPAEQAEACRLLAQLFRPPTERDPQAAAFFQSQPPHVRQRLDRFAAPAPDDAAFAAWVDAMEQTVNRAGLLACDDVELATRALARLGGEDLSGGEPVLLSLVPGASHLARWYLSDEFGGLHEALR